MSNNNEQHHKAVLDPIGAIRNRLLDMSRRNKLLNFDVRSKRSTRLIRIIDYSLSSLVTQLLDNDSTFLF